MISLYDSKITDVLPISIKNLPEVRSISYAVSNMNKKLINFSKKIALYNSIDTLDECILDILAVELRTQYYDESLDIKVKRKLIKNTLGWYMKAGTPSAVEELVEAVFGTGEVEEWFDFGGDPYTFRVTTNAELNPEGIEKFFKMINKVKNTRSHMDGLNKYEALKNSIYVANALSITKHTTINMNEKYLEREINVANGLSITKVINILSEEE